MADLRFVPDEVTPVMPVRRLVARAGHRVVGLSVPDAAATLLAAIEADEDLRHQAESLATLTGSTSLRAITTAIEEPHPALVRAVGSGHVISVRQGQAPIGAVRGLAVLGDGRRLVCGVREAAAPGVDTEFEWVDTVRTLNIDNGLWTDRRICDGGFVNAVAADRGGRWIVAGTTEGVVTRWAQGISDEVGLRFPNPHDGDVTCLAVSSDGTRAVSGATDGVLKVWDLVTGEPARTPSGEPIEYTGHRSPIWSIAFTLDGAVLTGSAAGEVHLWDPVTGEPRSALEAGAIAFGPLAATVGALAVAPNGRTVAVGCDDGTVQVVALTREGPWEPVSDLRGHTGGVSAAAFAPDGSWLATGGSDRAIRLWDPSSGELLTVATGHCDVVKELVPLAEGALLASVSVDNSVRLWDTSVRTPEIDADRAVPVAGIAALPSSDRFIASTWAGGVEVLSTATGQLLPSPAPRPGGKAVRCALTSDGRRAVTASREDRCLVVWNLDTNELIHEFEAHDGLLTCCTMAADDTVWSTSDRGELRRWGLDGQLLEERRGAGVPLWSLATGKDGSLLAGGRDAKAFLWRPDQDDPVTLEGHTADGVGCSIAGQLAITSGADGTIRLWDLETGVALEDGDGSRRVLRGHTAAVIATAVSPSGNWLASVSLDCTIRLWRIDGTMVSVFRTAGWLGDVAWVARDRVATVGGPGVYLFRVVDR